MCFYTDGSRDPVGNRTSFAVVCPQRRLYFSVRINDNFNIFQAEALAILEALKFIKDQKIKSSVIPSDSKSVLNALISVDRKGNADCLIYEIKRNWLNLKDPGLPDAFHLDPQSQEY